MEFPRAFTYIFRDRSWLVKLAVTGLLLALCPVPVVGLFCLCALLGYLAAIVRNVSNDYPRPLPVWDHIGDVIGKGAQVLLAILLYHAPPVFVIALLVLAREALSVSLFGSLTYAGVLAAVLPLLMLYIAFAWTLLAIGLVDYAETWDPRAFYQFDKLLRSLSHHGVLTLQWLVYSLAASLLMLVLLPFALLGLILFFPVQGYLTGAYGRRLRAAKLAYRQGRA